MTMSGDACGLPIPGVAGGQDDLVYYYTVFPNMLLSLFRDYVLVHRIEPQSPDHTRIYCDWLFHPATVSAPGFDPSGAIAGTSHKQILMGHENIAHDRAWECGTVVETPFAKLGIA